jgi:RES domain-containing protein
VHFVTFRLANYETPLWATANLAPGRYNRSGAGPTQYLSLHPMTPWAEILRAEGFRTREQAVLLRYPLWAVKLELADEPQELTFGNASDFGLSPDDLVADDWAPCQQLADELRSAGSDAFIAPSAALPGTRNLVILDARVATFYDPAPVGPEDLPVAMTSQDGRCPEGLWNLVHYAGAQTPHPGYQAWVDGDVFEFEEPLVTVDSLALV